MLLQLSKILILSLMIFLVKGQDSSSSTVSSSSSQFSSYSSSEFFPPSSESLNGQYIFSFTSSLYVMAIDINDGSLVVNQSLNQPIVPSCILSYDPTTYIFNYFGSYMDPYTGTQYLMANYTLEYNQITGVSRSIIDSLLYSEEAQPYVQIGNNFYMPIVDMQNPSTNLNIRNWNVKTFTVGTLEIELPDFNASLNSLDAYDSEKDLYYVFYYGNGDEVERIPYVSTFTGSGLSFYEDSSSNSGSNSNGGSISSFITTKFPNSGEPSLVYNNVVVSIFVKSSTLYAIEQLPTSINVLKLNLEDSSVELVYSSPIDRYTYDFISFFLTENNNYLVTLNLNQDNSILYSFIDLNTFVLAHSFSSPNYFDNNAEDFDTFFYFNGLI
ncbi:hypothetical protein ACTFIV_011186 [Dictyostelium citrinum]